MTRVDEYEDMIHRKPPKSKKHPPMDGAMRAAQFSPFAALTGHEEAILETARLTDRRPELVEDEKLLLDEKIHMMLEKCMRARITYFVADDRKEGGSYQIYQGRLKKVDEYSHRLIMEDRSEIPIDDIVEIQW